MTSANFYAFFIGRVLKLLNRYNLVEISKSTVIMLFLIT